MQQQEKVFIESCTMSHTITSSKCIYKNTAMPTQSISEVHQMPSIDLDPKNLVGRVGSPVTMETASTMSKPDPEELFGDLNT